MKPLVIFGLWALVGWNVGPWAEAYAGISAVVGMLAGVAIGAAFAINARRRIVARAVDLPQTTDVSSAEVPLPLDRAA